MELSFSTRRLKLRLVTLGDLLEVHELHALPETDEFNTLGIPEDLDQTREVLREWIGAAQSERNPEYTFVMRSKEQDYFVGLIALKCGNSKYRKGEVWYKLHVHHWGKGHATEALTGVLDLAFTTLKLHRIEAGCAVANTGSVRVLEKAGMMKEGRKRKVLPLKSGWSDNFEFAILEEDWLATGKE